MLIHASDHRPSSDLDDFSDNVVIGTGLAGIAVAINLARAGRKVTLLESNNQPQSSGSNRATGYSPYYQGGQNKFLDCTTSKYLDPQWGSGYPYGPDFLSNTRMRTFGGSSNCWGCQCIPLMPHDFDQRSWIPGSGWPFKLDDLIPYYRAASEMACVDNYNYFDMNYWKSRGYTDPFANYDQLQPVIAQQGQSQYWRWQELYRNELTYSKNIKVIMPANVTLLNMEGKSVASVTYLDYNGYSRTIPAKRVIVACGGVESARLLQFSEVPDPRQLIGKFFMVHPLITAAAVMESTDGTTPSFGGILSTTLPQGAKYQANMMAWGAVTAKAMKDHQSLNIRFFQAGANGKQVVNLNWEQASRAQNQVSLDWGNPDPAGNPRAKVNWELGKLEMNTITTALNAIEAFLKSRNPKWKLTNRVDQMVLPCTGLDNTMWGQYTGWGSTGVWAAEHHMGATRMSADPAQGVVDANCRVHTTDNLYVSSSSVFPTVGFSNPTYTIIAMALRLVDHLVSVDNGPVAIAERHAKDTMEV